MHDTLGVGTSYRHDTLSFKSSKVHGKGSKVQVVRSEPCLVSSPSNVVRRLLCTYHL